MPQNNMAVGLNKSLKVIKQGMAKKIYIASDSDRFFIAKVKDAVRQAGYTEIDDSQTSAALAEKAGISVPCAIITIY